MKTLIAIDCTTCQVSDCDYLFLSGYRWSVDPRGYFRCSNSEVWSGIQLHGKYLHWLVIQLMGLGVPKGYTIDHIDRNLLNNQRYNLRIASRRLQTYNNSKRSNNTSGFAGVSWANNKYKPWVAEINLPGERSINLGYFETPKEASEVYQAAKKIRDAKEERKICEDLALKANTVLSGIFNNK